MSVEIKPIGDKCNLKCKYCYEDSIRRHTAPVLDVDKMKQTLSRIGQHFTVFGGEPLLTPYELLRDFLAFGYEKFKANSIQTNGLALTPRIIELCKQYNVHVGLSFDGPGELNAARCSLPLTRTIECNIKDLFAAGIIPSFIITISKANAKPAFLDWLKELDALGVHHARLHNVEDNGNCDDLLLGHREQFEFFRTIFETGRTFKNLKFDVFDDIINALSGRTDKLTCIWNGCDPYNTSAVQGVKADGELENCGRIYKDGVLWGKSDRIDNVRQLILKSTPYEDGGCQGCEYFNACKGQCPGTAIDGDWRNRSRDCEFWRLLFDYLRPFATPCEPVGENAKQNNCHGDIPHGDHYSDHTDVNRIQIPVVRK